MNEKMEKSLDVLLAHSARHCHRFRLADHDFAYIPRHKLRALASSMLDHFEREIECLVATKGNNGESDASSGKRNEDASSASVLRSRMYR